MHTAMVALVRLWLRQSVHKSPAATTTVAAPDRELFEGG